MLCASHVYLSVWSCGTGLSGAQSRRPEPLPAGDSLVWPCMSHPSGLMWSLVLSGCNHQRESALGGQDIKPQTQTFAFLVLDAILSVGLCHFLVSSTKEDQDGRKYLMQSLLLKAVAKKQRDLSGGNCFHKLFLGNWTLGPLQLELKGTASPWSHSRNSDMPCGTWYGSRSVKSSFVAEVWSKTQHR